MFYTEYTHISPYTSDIHTGPCTQRVYKEIEEARLCFTACTTHRNAGIHIIVRKIQIHTHTHMTMSAAHTQGDRGGRGCAVPSLPHVLGSREDLVSAFPLHRCRLTVRPFARRYTYTHKYMHTLTCIVIMLRIAYITVPLQTCQLTLRAFAHHYAYILYGDRARISNMRHSSAPQVLSHHQ
jgi:hypothetical protein